MTSPRFDRAVAAFAAANARDPRQLAVDGVERPLELVHAERLVQWVERLVSEPSEALRLAAHCQHLERWEIPRSAYPEGRDGYLKWRRALAELHASKAEAVLRDVGYDEETIARVRRINLKQGVKRDPEVQAMEDALCLSFLEHEAAEFAARHTAEKVTGILKKTLVKMSDQGREAALALDLPAPVRAALEQALGT